MCGRYNSEMFRRRSLVVLISAATCAVVLSLRAAAADSIPSVLVSRQLFTSEKLSIGDVVTLSADRAGADPRQFRVAGSYEPLPDPMRLGAVRHEVRMHLPDLINMTADPRDPMSSETVDAINIAITKDTKGGDTPKGKDTKKEIPPKKQIQTDGLPKRSPRILRRACPG